MLSCRISNRGFAREKIWADTTTPHRKLMPTVLGGLAEFERTLIRSRTDEGSETCTHQRKLLSGFADGKSQLAIARTMGV